MLKNYFYATTATGVKILLSNLQFAYRCVCMYICVPDVRSITTVRSSITCCFSLTCSLRNSISCSSRVLLRSFKDVCLFSAGCADNFSFYKIKTKSVINKNVLKGLPITVRTSSHIQQSRILHTHHCIPHHNIRPLSPAKYCTFCVPQCQYFT